MTKFSLVAIALLFVAGLMLISPLVFADDGIRADIKDVRDAKKDLVDARKDVLAAGRGIVAAKKDILDARKEIRTADSKNETAAGLSDLKDARGDLREGRQDIVSAVKDRREAANELLKQRADLRKDVMEKRAAVVAKLPEKFNERDNRCKNLEGETRNICLKTEFGLHALKKCNDDANTSSDINCRAELKNKTIEYIEFHFEKIKEQIGLIEAQGYLNASEIAAINDYISAKKAAFANASTGAEKRAIIKEVIQKWNDFRKNIAEKKLLAKVKEKAADLRARLNTFVNISANMKTKGYNPTRLDAAIALAETKLNDLRI